MPSEIKIEPFNGCDQESIKSLLNRNLSQFPENAPVLVATFRRLADLEEVYSREGCQLFVAKEISNADPVACAGLGPLHGLPLSEGVGEIRDLVVEEGYRGQGIGAKLLHRCIKEAKALGYKRLYLETTENMIHAQKLFIRTGFRAVKDHNMDKTDNTSHGIPCYFLMENLENSDN